MTAAALSAAAAPAGSRNAAALHVEAALADRSLDLSLDLDAGHTLAVLGANGAGKSSLLNILAGLLRPDTGHATLADRTLFDLGDARPARWLPPHRRGVSLLAQQPLLFPHLTVLDNVAFGPRSAGQSRRQSRAAAVHWLEEVNALHLADRKPAQLSGGQSQRIAVARALASDPALLLLDEPLAALDVAVAQDVRRMLRRVLAARTVVVVTHDILDALTLADRVVVIRDGVIVEQGPTRQVLQRPRTRFTAELAGLNLLTGSGTATGLQLADGTVITGAAVADGSESMAEGSESVPDGSESVAGRAAAIAVSPSAVSVSTEVPPAGTPNVVCATIRDLDPHGDLVRVRSDVLAADVLPEVVVDLDLAAGTAVYFTFAPAVATLYAV
jgi:molybdate transport system ATP-binding protein